MDITGLLNNIEIIYKRKQVINNLIQSKNTTTLIKRIVPVLFVQNDSIIKLGLALKYFGLNVNEQTFDEIQKSKEKEKGGVLIYMYNFVGRMADALQEQMLKQVSESFDTTYILAVRFGSNFPSGLADKYKNFDQITIHSAINMQGIADLTDPAVINFNAQQLDALKKLIQSKPSVPSTPTNDIQIVVIENFLLGFPDALSSRLTSYGHKIIQKESTEIQPGKLVFIFWKVSTRLEVALDTLGIRKAINDIKQRLGPTGQVVFVPVQIGSVLPSLPSEIEGSSVYALLNKPQFGPNSKADLTNETNKVSLNKIQIVIDQIYK